MDENKIRVPIRSALVPNYYQRFHCLAQECRDTCCTGWNITFNKKDYLRLRRLDAPDSLKEKLGKCVVRERKKAHEGIHYGKFDLNSHGGRCPFLDPDGLCSIQRACGHESLPHVCTSYPRKIVYSPAAREFALSLSCEGVLQQLWELPDGVEFVEDPLSSEDQRDVEIAPGETLALYFAPLRAMCIDILQNRDLSLTQRMLYLGVVLQRLQGEDWTDFDPDPWSQQSLANADSVMTAAEKVTGNRDMYLLQNLNVLDAIYRTVKGWPVAVYAALEVKQKVSVSQAEAGQGQKVMQRTTRYSKTAYEDALSRFREDFGDREYFFENLMVAAALYLGFPDLGSREALWKSYVSLCSLYSFYRFVSVLGCKEEATKERLFHFLALSSRATLHNRNRFDGFQKELFQHDSSTLAHMAILLRWD